VQVYWQHLTGSGDANGVASWRVTSGGNGSAISAGGYVGVHTTGSQNEQNGASAQGLMPLVALFPVRNNEEADWDMVVGFAVPTGVNVEAHLWVATA
jgi:hypothetical protein